MRVHWVMQCLVWLKLLPVKVTALCLALAHAVQAAPH